MIAKLRVEQKSFPTLSRGASVYLDDTDISTAIGGIHIDHQAHQIPEVTLTLGLAVYQYSLGSAEVLIGMNDDVKNLLVKLGWKPPENGESSDDVESSAH